MAYASTSVQSNDGGVTVPRNKRCWFLGIIVIIAAANVVRAQQPKEFKNWPAGTSPQEVGKRVAERFVVTPHTNFGRPEPATFITYPESVAWYGALTFTSVSGDKELTNKLVRRFDPLFGPEASFIPEPTHVDLTVFGVVPLQIYIDTREQKYLDLGERLADAQWQNPQD